MSKTKILIVDDYKENIEALAGLIAADDIEIHSAMNADGALDLLVHHDFGLALLDVQMPQVNGFELAKLIRGVRKFKNLPIIFVTAHREDRAVLFQGYETGAVDLLFKPLDPGIVRSKVRVFVELSQQKQLLEAHVKELERLRIEAEAANVAKTQFLANMSHEIRTPLAAVMGFSELIARGQYSEEEKDECVASIRRNGSLLLRLIDDILDLSKIEANRLEFERMDFDLNEILRDIGSTLSFKAQEKGIELKLHVPNTELPHYVSDPIRLKQILLNIIGNSIKFSSKGVVDVTVRVGPDDISRNFDRLQVLVRDQGIGLSAEQVARLFQPFGQADPSTRRNFGGSGLGLVISRQIARALGGDLRLIQSTPEIGSTFEIEIPLERSRRESASEIKRVETAAPVVVDTNVDLSARRILAVDDSPDNLTLIQMFLRSTKANVTYVENGVKALTEAQKQTFDLILMDVQMPGMDGHETTEELRRMGFTGPIVALTAHAIKSEHDKCLKSGCNGVLVKPINKKGLVTTILHYLPTGANSRIAALQNPS